LLTVQIALPLMCETLVNCYLLFATCKASLLTLCPQLPYFSRSPYELSVKVYKYILSKKKKSQAYEQTFNKY